MSARSLTAGFFWQGLFILLPVTLLAGIGGWALWQDRVLVRHEAVARAEAVAAEVVERLWRDLTEVPEERLRQGLAFRIDSAGNLEFPPPIQAVPEPNPLDPAELEVEERLLWETATRLDAPVLDSIAAANRSVESDLPHRWRAVAHFRLGVLLEAHGDVRGAVEQFAIVGESFPNIRGESGLPLGPLAELKRLALADSLDGFAGRGQVNDWDGFYSNVVNHPTPVSSYLLESGARMAGNDDARREAVARGLEEWDRQTMVRQLFDAVRPQLPRVVTVTDRSTKEGFAGDLLSTHGTYALPSLPRFVWFEMTGLKAAVAASDSSVATSSSSTSVWLATRIDVGPVGGGWFACRQLGYVIARPFDNARFLSSALSRASQVDVPEYFGISLELAGRALMSSNNLPSLVLAPGGKRSGSGQRWKRNATTTPGPVLASADYEENGRKLMTTRVHLIGPDMLFARQRERTLWFGLLIGAAAVAAVAGFVSARRAFHNQVRLAQMKSNFVSSVSHELRAPIASVRLMAEGLERGRVPDEERQREYFRFMVQECRRLSGMIENVLDFSRIEQGRKEYEFEPTDLTRVVAETVRLMEPYAAERDVNLKQSFGGANGEGSDAQAELDGRAIQQALVNLIDNAVKHSPAGGVVTVGLEYRAAPDAEPGSHGGGNRSDACFVLWVQDHGPGIPAEEQERIFERFYRRGSELRRETQGVGIGLSIVKHAVDAHGGRVRVESNAGEGSRFVIELPACPAAGRERTG